ncbi:hypothetical protein, partial [Actinomadura sp. WAC 06369]|uniref:hypothetical protein n=1 Tax=Actinomadura sp. WAC 06369 TaxID=2203193 RepID=UPI001002976D
PPPPPRAARSKLGPDSRFALGCAGLAATFWFGVLAVGVYGAFLSPDDAPEPPPPIPADLAGTWTGKITEKGEKEGGWKAKFVLRKGEQGGKATYRDGKCTGSFVTVSYREGILTLDTTFPADKPDCDGGDVRLSLRDDGRLDAVYPPAGERKVEAAGKLRRK